MTHLEAALLGILQGLTEFLPVSSSGHLVLAQALFGSGEPGMLFEVSVHLGTLIAVLIFYRQDILQILRGSVTGVPAQHYGIGTRQWMLLLVAASIPAAVVGLGFKDAITQTFSDPVGTSIRLLATGALLFSTIKR